MTIRRALFSVYDKTGLAAFARELSGLGVELLASSGSATLLADERIPVTPLADVTGFGDLLGHRVVTLHPAVHGGILARRDLPEDMAELRAHEIAPIDLVCVNLYPFERTVGRLDVAWEDAIEQIDIGGPALLRAAAKNHAHVVPISRPEDYGPRIEEFRMNAEVSAETHRVIDEEVRLLVERCDNEVRQLLSENRDKLDALVKALMERETLDEADAYAVAGVEPPPAVRPGEVLQTVSRDLPPPRD